ncbi:hypothetical protein AGMMS49982_08170 [Bacteroidia bacterium]|nr:hypothetical protein AGMMS49982_08170 [Bacteroidia bacterium]
MKKVFYIGSLFVAASAGLLAQGTPDNLMSSPQMTGKDGLGFAVEATGFFKNTEFFSPLEVGQTLPGIQFVPRVTYQIDKKFRIEWGAYAVYYSGDETQTSADNYYYAKTAYGGFSQMFVRMQYAVNPDFHLVFGNLYGGLNHRLIEPLYQWERHYTARPESGLQVHFQNKKYFADVWLDWEQFIRYGDPKPELLTFGISASALLTAPESRFRLTVPFQLLIHHQGGQIDTSDAPKIVIGNAATGFDVEWLTGHNLLKTLSLKTYIAGYADNTADKALRPFTKGWGIYPVLEAKTNSFTLAAGYWHAQKFYAFEGESLFGSFNPYEPEKQFPTRDLVIYKLLYQKQLHEKLQVGAQVEVYQDCGLRQADYSFGAYLRFKY